MVCTDLPATGQTP